MCVCGGGEPEDNMQALVLFLPSFCHVCARTALRPGSKCPYPLRQTADFLVFMSRANTDLLRKSEVVISSRVGDVPREGCPRVCFWSFLFETLLLAVTVYAVKNDLELPPHFYLLSAESWGYKLVPLCPSSTGSGDWTRGFVKQALYQLSYVQFINMFVCL